MRGRSALSESQASPPPGAAAVKAAAPAIFLRPAASEDYSSPSSSSATFGFLELTARVLRAQPRLTQCLIAAMTRFSLSSTSKIRSSPLITPRSEEHTSELQSLMRISYAVFCLKKKHHTIKQQD